MRKDQIIARMFTTRVMGIVRCNSIDRAREIVRGCLAGGVDIIELSLNSPDALTMICTLKSEFGNRLVLGAGTVLDAIDAKLALNSGADFIIAPNFDMGVARICNREQIPYCPGCTSISEIIEAAEYGATLIKLFPASNFWGPNAVKVINTPLPKVPIMASGGVNLDNVDFWRDAGVAVCGVGGVLTQGSEELIKQNASALVAALH